MPICLTTAHWKSSGMVSSKRFKLDCSSSVVLFFTEEEQSSLKRLEETIPELFQCAVVRQMSIDIFI